MPIYEYKCVECGDTREVLEKEPSDGYACYTCNSGYMVRVFSFSVKRSGQEMPPERR